MSNKAYLYLLVKITLTLIPVFFIGHASIPFLYKPFLFWLTLKIAFCNFEKVRDCMFTNLEYECVLLKRTLFISLIFFITTEVTMPLFSLFVLLTLLLSLQFKFNYKVSVLIFIGTMIVSYLALFFVFGIENSEIFDMFFSFNNFKF